MFHQVGSFGHIPHLLGKIFLTGAPGRPALLVRAGCRRSFPSIKLWRRAKRRQTRVTRPLTCDRASLARYLRGRQGRCLDCGKSAWISFSANLKNVNHGEHQESLIKSRNWDRIRDSIYVVHKSPKMTNMTTPSRANRTRSFFRALARGSIQPDTSFSRDWLGNVGKYILLSWSQLIISQQVNIRRFRINQP